MKESKGFRDYQDFVHGDKCVEVPEKRRVPKSGVVVRACCPAKSRSAMAEALPGGFVLSYTDNCP